MSPPRILVIGQGSIGRRHATNLRALGADVTVVDVEFDGRVPPGFGGVVVASPTVLHAEHAAAALATGAAVFVEKPMASDAAAAFELADSAGDRLMVGYNLRFHAPLQRVAALLRGGRAGTPHSYRFWFGQWLPDWRPTVDYRQSYSARADLGGGILADAIHELDLAVWMVGEPLEVVGAVVGSVGPLEIDVEDMVRAVLRTAAGVPVTIELDYLARQYRRGVEVIGSEATVGYDWSTKEVTVRSSVGTTTEVFHDPLDDAYVAEMASFLGLVASGVHPGVNGGGSAVPSLVLADAIRASA
ncbi:MAG: Gfo/Idh/MocA family oxidoreductase [Microthrixaceae bacterium]|nr:Gfo/Idh/MocA family oxidoreductase [Microthrixaceae bacterium]